ncbi:MAG: hypothetical protein ACE5GY_08205 [Thermodesulfobacteriota bacterium]
MDRLFSSRWFSPAVVLAIIVSVVLAYSNTFDAAFQFDDMPNIVNNGSLRDLGNIGRVLWNTRGVTYATFALNYALGGPGPFGFHAVNTAVHIINSVLAYFILLATFGLLGWETPRSRMVAAFSALLFALHPVQTQAVTYIIQRMESLSATFYLAALLLFIKGAAASTPAKKAALWGLTGLSYVLSFYSKETAITLPAVVLLYDFCFISRGGVTEIFRRRWPVYGALAALFVIFTAVTIMPMGGFNDLSDESSGATVAQVEAPSIGTTAMAKLKRSEATALSAGFSLKNMSPGKYLTTQFNVITYYFALFLVPMNQNLDYDFPVATGLFTAPKANHGAALTLPMLPPVVSLLVLLIIIGYGVYAFARTQKNPSATPRVAAFFIFWFFIIISPTSSIVPITDVIYEHRVYLPSLGFFTVFVLCVEAVVSRALDRRGA